MKNALLLFCLWLISIYGVALTIVLMTGCTPASFPIGKGISVESIRIEPVKKSVYRVERYA